MDLNDLEKIRVEKINKLKENHIEPYPTRSYVNSTIKKACEAYEAAEAKGETDNTEYILAGRMRSLRVMGKLACTHIEDSTGRLQLFLRVPGILGIHVGWDVVALHLDVSGDPDAVPAGEIVTRLPEAVRRGSGIAGITEAPDPVQRHPEPALARGQLRGIPVGDEIRVSGEASVGKDRGIFHNGFKIKCFHIEFL